VAIATRVQWMDRDERGSILLGGLMLMWIITLVGSGVFALAVIENRMAHGDAMQAQAFYTAEAGLNAALRELADGDGTNDFSAVFNAAGTTTIFANKLLADGRFTVTVQAVAGSNPKRLTVTSTGCVPAGNSCPTGQAQVTLQGGITYQLGLAGPFFALGKFSIGGGGSLVDSFDSSQGTYTQTKCPQTTPQLGCGADIYADGAGANPPTTTVTVSAGNGTPIYGNIADSRGQVNLSNNAAVWGNVTYDSQQGSFSGSSSQVKGSLIDAPTTPPVPGAVQPCGPPYSPGTDVNVGNNTKMHIVNPPNRGSINYDATTGVFSFTGSNGGHMSIDPWTFCFRTFSVSGQGVVDIPSGQTVPVVINVTEAVNLSSGGIANATLKAQNFQIISSYTGATNGVQISGGPSAYMYVYAPQTQITVSGGADLYGALLGKDLTAAGGAKLHFDKALGNSGNLYGGVPAYAWGSWKVCRNPQCT
jgi:Tfp pilus assembly protein PilX